MLRMSAALGVAVLATLATAALVVQTGSSPGFRTTMAFEAVAGLVLPATAARAAVLVTLCAGASAVVVALAEDPRE